MLVYRIENEYGYGPYRNNYKIGEYVNNPKRHNVFFMDFGLRPTPNMDGIDDFDESYFCGFESLNSLKIWFGEKTTQKLSNDGYLISIYEIDVDFVKFGERQVVFQREKASLVEKISYQTEEPCLT